MTRKKNPFGDNKEFDEIGAPFEGFGSGDYPYNTNSRIMPTQFNYPNFYMNYAIIRDIENDDNNTDY